MFDIGVTQGDIATLTENGVFLYEGLANKRDLTVGSTITFGLLNGMERRLTVEGIYSNDDLPGNYVVSHRLHEQSGADQFDNAVYLSKESGVTESAARGAIASVTDGYPNATLRSRTEYIDSQSAFINQLVNLMYGLLGLAVIIALFSIANSMVLSVHERTRELGLLRAVGTTRPQVRMAVTLEAVLISLLGAVLGLVIGVFFGWSTSVALRKEGWRVFTIPWTSLLLITGLAVVGAVLASLRPAWRASRLDILRAIASE